MAHYEPVDGVYRKVTKHYEPVDGVHRNVTKAYKPVDGVYRQYFSSGTPVGSLAVGDSVWLNVNGSLKEFLVVHKGNPDSAIYDASCDGTWLLMKDIYEKRAWDSDNNNYASSDIHSYLNGTFLKLFDTDVQPIIKQVKIPYQKNTGSVVSGSSGKSARIFLLSCLEVGSNISGSGACLDYFSGTSAQNDAKRIGYYNGTATDWFLRTPNNYSENYLVYIVNSSGGASSYTGCMSSKGIRPAFILDSNTPIDNSTGINIIA